MFKGLTGRAILVLAAGFLVMFMGGGSRFAIGLVLKPMVGELGWTRGSLGFAVAVFMAVSAVFSFWAGQLADRFPLRWILGGGLVLMAAGIGPMGLITQPWQVLALYGGLFAIGSGIASLTPVGVLVTRWFPGRTGLANALATSGMAIGQLVMIALLAAILLQIGWRAMFGWLGLLIVLVVPFVLWAVVDDGRTGLSDGPARPAAGMSVSEALRTRRFWLMGGLFAICGFQDFFVTTHVVALALDRGTHALIAGNLLAAMGLTSLIGVLLIGQWSDRTGPVWGTLFSFSLRLAVFTLVLFRQDTLSLSIFALVYGFSFLMTAPLTVVFVLKAFGARHLGALTGLITMIHHGMGGLGAWLGAVAFDRYGNYDAAFATVLVFSIVAMGCTLALRGHRLSA